LLDTIEIENTKFHFYFFAFFVRRRRAPNICLT
jgi:hypothetical protein